MNQMNDEERNKRAEQWLDAALSRYDDAEPRPGFDIRLLARVAAEREKAPRWRWMWIGAAVAAAAVMLVVALSVGRRSEAPQVANVPAGHGAGKGAQGTAPNSKSRAGEDAPNTFLARRTHPSSRNGGAGEGGAPSNDVAVAADLSQRSGTRRRARHPLVKGDEAQAAILASSPKQPQFPTPAPLSEQERLLLAYVRSTPKQEIETVIAQRQAFQEEFDKLGVPQEQEKSER